MDLIFHALANGQRRKILDLVKNMPGCSLNDVCKYFAVSRIAVMKHLEVLVEAQLILSEKKGRRRQLYFNAAPIQMIYDRWTTEYSRFWVTQAVDLKYQVEQQEAIDARHAKTDSANLDNRKSGKR